MQNMHRRSLVGRWQPHTTSRRTCVSPHLPSVELWDFELLIVFYKMWSSSHSASHPFLPFVRKGLVFHFTSLVAFPARTYMDLDAHHRRFIFSVVQRQLWVEPAHSLEQTRSLPSSNASFWSTTCTFCSGDSPTTWKSEVVFTGDRICH